MNAFIKLSSVVQALTILCASGIIVVAMINQVAGAALVALVAAVAAIWKRGDNGEE